MAKVIKIFTVDDHPLLREGIAAVIQGEPDMVLVAEATNGQEAIERFRLHRPDVTLMDIQMPVMDGVEAVTRIRRQEHTSGQHLPVVALTAHAMKEDEAVCLAAGMDGYVTKPINPPDLYAVIERLLE